MTLNYSDSKLCFAFGNKRAQSIRSTPWHSFELMICSDGVLMISF